VRGPSRLPVPRLEASPADIRASLEVGIPEAEVGTPGAEADGSPRVLSQGFGALRR